MKTRKGQPNGGGILGRLILGLLGAVGVLFSLGWSVLACVVAQANPGERLHAAIFCGIIFIVSVVCLFMAVGSSKSRR